jgi:hypothetical protein
MKRIVLLAAVLLAGCVVQSYYPFCTEKSVTDLKPLLGQWTLKSNFGDDVSEKKLDPWVFNAKGTLEVVDPEGASAEMGVKLFKLGDSLFLDVMPKNPSDESKVNQYWMFTVRQSHTVCKVILEENRLTLLPLDFVWLKDELPKLAPALPMLGKPTPGGDLPLFTASPEQWETFLRAYGGNTNAFPKKFAVILTKPAPAKKSEP